MKISPPKNGSFSVTKRAAILPLVPEEAGELNSSNSVSYALRVTPADADSPTHKKYVRVLTGSEDVRTVLTWIVDSKAVVRGLNVTTPTNEYTLMLNLV